MLTEKNDRQTILRQSNIELLRIVAMVIIVAHHFAVHSGFAFSPKTITINRLWIQFIQIGGKIGVDIFVLISGYFLISQQSVKTKKVVALWGKVFFYSIALYLVFVVSGLTPFGIKELIMQLAPIAFSQWWFASTYFVLYLLVPYINKLLRMFDKEQYVRFLALLLLLWSVIPSFTGQALESNSLLWFVVLYAIAGYIKLFDIRTKLTGAKLIGLSIFCIVLTFLSAVAFDIIGTKIPIFGAHATFFYSMQKLPVLVISVLMFVGFTKIDIGYSKFVNMISSATFGVYLIHDNRYVRPFIWKTVFQNASYAESNLLIPHSLIAIAVVFVGCSIIELARIYLIEKNITSAINKISILIDSKINSLLSGRALNMLKQ